MFWFNLNYIFGELFDTSTSSFFPESSVERSDVPDSYDGRGNDDHAEEVMSSFRPHCSESFLSCLAMIMVMGLRIMKSVTVPRTYKNSMAITFSLVVPRAYNKTLVSLLTRKSHWVTSNPLTLKFRTKLTRYG
ncbi:hypothetical protein Hanom_Chr00s108721g01806821 [Helianthus anomalus]